MRTRRYALRTAIVGCIAVLVPWRWSRDEDSSTLGFEEQAAIGEDAMATDGLTTVQSNFGVKETMDRLEAEVKAKGLTVFTRVDHAAGAAAVGMQLRPTELLIFGNARGGTPLMQANQVAGIDLPLKALAYEDGSGKVWLAYDDPSWIAQRHRLGAGVAATVHTLTKALEAFVAHAVKSP